jgi:hypothetical protein
VADDDEVVAASPRTWVQDIDSHPRGLVVGADLQTGARTTGLGQVFRVVGPQLVPVRNSDEFEFLGAVGFDTATGDPPFFFLFEWLDDNTVALTRGNASTHAGDIVVCHLSGGRCAVAVEAPHGDATRIVANWHLPG